MYTFSQSIVNLIEKLLWNFHAILVLQRMENILSIISFIAFPATGLVSDSENNFL